MTKKQAIAQARVIREGVNLAEWVTLPDGIRVAILGRNYLTSAGEPSTEILATGYSWEEAVARLADATVGGATREGV